MKSTSFHRVVGRGQYSIGHELIVMLGFVALERAPSLMWPNLWSSWPAAFLWPALIVLLALCGAMVDDAFERPLIQRTLFVVFNLGSWLALVAILFALLKVGEYPSARRAPFFEILSIGPLLTALHNAKPMARWAARPGRWRDPGTDESGRPDFS